MLNPGVSPNTNYAGMYLDANSTATVLETAGIDVALRQFTTGSLQDWTFSAGSTGAITAFSDGTGKVNVASGTHGLVSGDIISIRGTTNYNGVWEVTYIDADNFSIADTWVADDGASDWDQGSYLQCGASGVGTYALSWNMSSSEGGAGGSTVTYKLYKNATAQTKTFTQRKFSNNDIGSIGGSGIIDNVAVGDRIFLTASSGGTNDITNAYGDIVLFKL